MTMISRLVRFSRRHIHTIISKEMIKPSSPTPSHLKTHNLSVLDQIGAKAFMPMVVFYEGSGFNRSSMDKTLDLKNSLSRTLSKYYPFAGRHGKIAPSYVDCNDEGAEFLEASIDGKLEDFLQNSKHEDYDQFFPHGLVNYESTRSDKDLESSDSVIPLAVQVNHFECGGMAVAVSLSHKIADGSSLGYFVHDWAKMNRFKGPKEDEDRIISPHFIRFQEMNMNFKGFDLDKSRDCVTRSFIFSNSKINDLKLKVAAMAAESGEPITNPTRVEVLGWLIYKSAVSASIKNDPGFKSNGVGQLINIRRKMIEPVPENTIGNLFLTMEILRNNEPEIRPEWFISELKKQKTLIGGIPNIEAVLGLLSSGLGSRTALEERQRKIDDAFICTSLCRHPAYEIDFGFGKPVKVTFGGNLRKNSVVMLDSRNEDGIEALVCLEKRDMAVFRADPELLEFC